jgi:hypothetical protein
MLPNAAYEPPAKPVGSMGWFGVVPGRLIAEEVRELHLSHARAF